MQTGEVVIIFMAAFLLYKLDFSAAAVIRCNINRMADMLLTKFYQVRIREERE